MAGKSLHPLDEVEKALERSTLPTLTPRKYQCRLAILGAANVGKTAIIEQFIFKKFMEEYKKTIEVRYIATFKYSSFYPIEFEILDTGGSFELQGIESSTIGSFDAFFLVYSVDNEASWKYIGDLWNEVCTHNTFK